GRRVQANSQVAVAAPPTFHTEVRLWPAAGADFQESWPPARANNQFLRGAGLLVAPVCRCPSRLCWSALERWRRVAQFDQNERRRLYARSPLLNLRRLPLEDARRSCRHQPRT